MPTINSVQDQDSSDTSYIARLRHQEQLLISSNISSSYFCQGSTWNWRAAMCPKRKDPCLMYGWRRLQPSYYLPLSYFHYHTIVNKTSLNSGPTSSGCKVSQFHLDYLITAATTNYLLGGFSTVGAVCGVVMACGGGSLPLLLQVLLCWAPCVVSLHVWLSGAALWR